MNRSDWDDYDYHMHTGELKEYFEDETDYYDDETDYYDDETDYYDDERTKKTAHQPIEFCEDKDLDDVIRNLKKLKKENERILREQKKKEAAQKKKATSQQKKPKTTPQHQQKQSIPSKEQTKKEASLALKWFVIIIWILFLLSLIFL